MTYPIDMLLPAQLKRRTEIIRGPGYKRIRPTNPCASQNTALVEDSDGHAIILPLAWVRLHNRLAHYHKRKGE